MDIDDMAERVEVLRDRFVSWGLLVGFVSFVAAVWITEPTVEVEVPLPAGTKIRLNVPLPAGSDTSRNVALLTGTTGTNVSFNVGYGLVLGMPLLALAYAWSMAPLLAVQRYQEAVAREISAGNMRISDFEKLRMIGPQGERGAVPRLGRVAHAMSFGTRVLVLFMAPILGQAWIAEAYFFELKYFDKSEVVSQRLAQLATSQWEGWNIIPRGSPRLSDYFFSETPSGGAVRAEYYFVESGILEEPCVRSWVREALSTNPPTDQAMKALAQHLAQEPDATMRCVFTSFPNFKFWLNSWVNLLSLLAVVCLAGVGLEVYSGRYFRRRLPPSSPPRLPPELSSKQDLDQNAESK